MVNYKLDAIYELRKYVWDELKKSEIFDIHDYYSDNIGQEIIPIIPVQQSPELSQFLSGKKHIVYDKIGISYDDIWLICNEQILFTIYTTDFSEINEIRNIMVDLFRRMDESAKDVNYSDVTSELFKFHTIYITEISPTAPSQEIQGFLATDVVLDIKYSRNTDNSGRIV